jgi:hypothetical protein
MIRHVWYATTCNIDDEPPVVTTCYGSEAAQAETLRVLDGVPGDDYDIVGVRLPARQVPRRQKLGFLQ